MDVSKTLSNGIKKIFLKPLKKKKQLKFFNISKVEIWK